MNELSLIRTSNQWFHHHREPTKMYSKRADTFVSLELLVQVMPSIYMEGRSCYCCSRPNQQIKVVHCRPCMRKKSKSGMHEEPRRTIQIESKEEEGRDWNLHRVTRAGIRKHRGGHGGDGRAGELLELKREAGEVARSEAKLEMSSDEAGNGLNSRGEELSRCHHRRRVSGAVDACARAWARR